MAQLLSKSCTTRWLYNGGEKRGHFEHSRVTDVHASWPLPTAAAPPSTQQEGTLHARDSALDTADRTLSGRARLVVGIEKDQVLKATRRS